LRYPGGKGKIANFLKVLFAQNGFVGYEYVELYAGGASIALSLLFEDYASRVHINDLNRSVFAFWHAVLNAPEKLCRRIVSARLTMTEWERQRAVQRASDPDIDDLAYSTFFLNRTNRSGILDGGVIGGKDQRGKWKLDARFNVRDLVRRIEKVARHRSRITLTQMDAAVYLRKWLPRLDVPVFLYLDPPYYVKGRELYEHAYEHDDHATVARLIRKISKPWAVSYDATPQILKLYDGCQSLRYSLSYSAGDRHRGSEAMFFSALVAPPQVQPAGVPTSAVLSAQRLAIGR
jgi:DNA adenine methylase